MIRQLNETQVQRMSNDELLRELANLRTATSNGSILPSDTRAARSNLKLLTQEEAERVRLKLLVVAPPQPAYAVYAPQTTPRVELQRRLHTLQLQAGRYGINTPPEVLNEIEDIEARLR